MAQESNPPDAPRIPEDPDAAPAPRSAARRYLPVAVTFLVGAAVTVAAFLTVRDWERVRDQQEFSGLASLHAHAIQRSFDGTTEAFRSIRRFFGASREVLPGEFRTFVTEILEERAFIRCLLWAPRVPPDRREAFEERLAETGEEAFIRESLPRAEVLYPVLYAEPDEGARGRRGLDLGGPRATRVAVDEALRTGAPAAGPIVDALDEPGSKGVWLAVPVREAGSGGDATPEVGVVTGLVDLRVLVDHALEAHGVDEVHLELRDAAEEGREARVHWSSVEGATAPAASIRHATRLALGGRSYLATFHAIDRPAGRLGGVRAREILVGGIVITLLIVIYLGVVTRQRNQLGEVNRELVRQVRERRRAEEGLRRSEERMRTLVHNAPLILFTIDREGTVTFAEGRGLASLGLSSEEVTGEGLFSLFPAQSEELREDLRRALVEDEFSTITRLGDVFFETHTTRLRSEEDQVVGVVGVATDITERREAELALRRSEERIRTVVASSPIVLFAFDRDGVLTLSEGQALARIGLEPGEAVGESIFDLYADAPEILANARRALQGEEFTTLVEHAGRIFEASYSPVLGEEGDVVKVIGVANDITERRVAQETLTRIVEGTAAVTGEAFFENLTRHLSDALDVRWAFVAEGLEGGRARVISMCDGSERVDPFAWDLEGTPCAEVYAEETPVVVAEEVTDRHPDDLWLEENGVESYLATPFRDASGEVIGHLGVMDAEPIERTGPVESVLRTFAARAGAELERQRAEEALEESRRTLRTLISNLPGMVYRCRNDRDWSMEFVSEGARELTGYPVEDFVENRVTFGSDITHPDDRDEVWEEVQAALDERRPFRLLYRIRTRSGEEKWCWEQGSGVWDEEGEVVALEGFVTDITDRKRAEERVEALNVELEERVARRTAQLRAANRVLAEQNRRVEEAARMKSAFLANMSHELRTPLHGIIGFAELLHDEKVGPVPEEHREYLADILSCSRHLLRLINDVLDLSKIESGKMPFRPEEIDLPSLVEEVRDTLVPLAAKKDLEVRTELDEEVGEVVADPAKLKQILYNYLSNAMKFSSREGRVTVRCRPEENGSYRIEVEDRGIGIAPEDQERLFEEFQQLDSGRDDHQGTGLGLALTKRLVEAQGGEVGVRSTPGEGSVFWAILPREVEVEEVEVVPSGPTASERGEGEAAAATADDDLSVLIVDDNPTNLKLLTLLLESEGMGVATASSANEALDALETTEEGGPDLILMDLQMPGMDGLELTRRIRDDGELADVVIIALTGYAMASDRRRALEAGCDGFLAKPVDTSDLLAVMREHLGSRASSAP